MKKAKKTKKQEGVTFTKEQFSIILDGFFDQINDKVLDLVFTETEECNSLISEMLNFIAQKVVNEEKFPITAEALKDKVAQIVKDEGDGMAQSLLFNQVEYVKAHPQTCKGLCENCKCKHNNELEGSVLPDFDKTRGLN